VYVQALQNGALSRAQAAQNFVNSPENRGNQVRYFYRYFLGREASPAEVTFYSDYLRSGGDEGRVRQNFILSPEYAGLATDTQFVQTMYYALLGRAGSRTEIEFYVSALGGGQTTRDQVVLNFAHSPESIGRVARGDAIAYLERPPTDAELAAAVAAVQGGASFGSLSWGLLGSAEFFANAGKYL